MRRHTGLVLALFGVLASFTISCASSQKPLTETASIQLTMVLPEQVHRGEEFIVHLEVANKSETPIRFCADPGSFHFRGNGYLASSPITATAHASCANIEVVNSGSTFSWQERTQVPRARVGGDYTIYTSRRIIAPASCKNKNCSTWIASSRGFFRLIY